VQKEKARHGKGGVSTTLWLGHCFEEVIE